MSVGVPLLNFYLPVHVEMPGLCRRYGITGFHHSMRFQPKISHWNCIRFDANRLYQTNRHHRTCVTGYLSFPVCDIIVLPVYVDGIPIKSKHGYTKSLIFYLI